MNPATVMRPALWSFAIQALGSAATVGAALLVASRLGLAAQGDFGLLRSWNDALITAAALGLPQGVLHLHYREGVPVASLSGWVVRYVSALAALVALLIAAALLWSPPQPGAGVGAHGLLVLAAAVPLAVAHLLCRSLVLRDVDPVSYALITAAPSLLVLAGLLPICLAGWGEGLVWPLFASAILSALASAWLVRRVVRAGPAQDLQKRCWSRRTLWSIGIETGGQNVLMALGPALLLSTTGLLGASLAEVGVVSLCLHVYQMFGVAAAYVAPMVYDRAARSGQAVDAGELFRQLRRRITGPVVLAGVGGVVLVTVAVVVYWPSTLASPLLLLVMAFAGVVSMAVKLLATLMLARGAFRALSFQASGRLLAACGGTALLMQILPATSAVGAALMLSELLSLGWLLAVMKRLGAQVVGASPPPQGPRLVMVTTNYPYTYNGGEVMFVEPEMRRLARVFGELTVAPLHAAGERLDVPPGVVVDTRLARLMRRRVFSYTAVLVEAGFWREMGRAAQHGGWVGCIRVWRWAATAHITLSWARANYPGDPRLASPVLFYTYWRGGSTVALARFALERPLTGVVTRTHGYELYEERFNPPFQPWHPDLYGKMTLTAAISQHGIDYLRAAGVADDRLALFRLGTERLTGRARASSDGVFRIVSCSFLTPLKRVPLLAQALMAFAVAHPARHIEWTHFGDGPDLARVKSLLDASPSNFHATLSGHVPNERVLQHYLAHPVDVFVLLSESEGLPVSIQEAVSAGVPIIATDVGGVSELVGEDNGRLLPKDCQVADVVAALDRLFDKSDVRQRQAMRDASWGRWAEGFDAEANHLRFAHRLQALLNTLHNPLREPNET